MVFIGTGDQALANSEYAGDRFGVRFALQTIANTADLSVYGYEFLYRGKVRPTSPTAWVKVDQGVLKYLGGVALGLGKPCFINLSHESFMAIPEAVFVTAAEKNELRFELSEAVAESGLFEEVCNKVNRLIGYGMHFAIDDFGAGLDGSRRLYALDKVAVIKVDRGLLISAAGRSNAAKMLAASVASWQAAGIQTVAEGVETAELLAFAKGVGFDLVQGWHVDNLAPGAQRIISRSFF
ncbi:MAG: EAL domain-containing protein [Burkholderiaceae bacterium]|nr:EAL domain-containing protein [Burkholderiaceae bacterium]